MTGQVPRLPSPSRHRHDDPGVPVAVHRAHPRQLTRGRWQTKRMSYLLVRVPSEKTVKALAAFWAQRFVRFAAVGGAAFSSTKQRSCSQELLQAGDKLGWFVAFFPAVTFTWWGNRKLTFAEHASEGHRGMLAEWAVSSRRTGGPWRFAVYAVLTAYAPWPFRIAYSRWRSASWSVSSSFSRCPSGWCFGGVSIAVGSHLPAITPLSSPAREEGGPGIANAYVSTWIPFLASAPLARSSPGMTWGMSGTTSLYQPSRS